MLIENRREAQLNRQSKTITSVLPTEKDRNGRLIALDIMRGLAALAVLVEHGGYRFLPHFASFTHNSFSTGKFGLAAFFLVSGFVIPFSLDRHPDLRRFWVLRFCRLFPIYWFSLLAALAMYEIGFGDALTPGFQLHIVRNAIANLTMMQGVLGIPHAIGLYYTLTIEMVFYIVCTLLVMLKSFHRTYSICWVILLAASVLAIVEPLLLHRRVEMAGLFYVVTLAFGSVVYRLYTGELSRSRFAWLAGGMTVFVVAGVWLNYSVYKKDDAFEHYGILAVLVPWLAAYLLFGFLLTNNRVSSPRPLLWVGKISYSLYLLHPLVLGFFAVHVGNIAGFVAFTVISFLLSSVTYLFIERPVMEFARSLRTSKPKLIAV